jgi:predicted short-subunit dehydrogenase-like oxidoreductase (DUF2520 family)
MELLSSIGVAAPGELLRQLVDASVEGALRDGDRALTGPIARGDFATVRQHLESLRSAPDDIRQTYIALARATAKRQQRELDHITEAAMDQ